MPLGFEAVFFATAIGFALSGQPTPCHASDIVVAGTAKADENTLLVEARLSNVSEKTRCVRTLGAYPELNGDTPIGFASLSQSPEIPQAPPGIIGLAIAPGETQNLTARYAVAPFSAHKVTIEGVNNPETEADINARLRQEMLRGLYQIVVEFHSGECLRPAQSVAHSDLPLHVMSRDLAVSPVERHIIGEVFVPGK